MKNKTLIKAVVVLTDLTWIFPLPYLIILKNSVALVFWLISIFLYLFPLALTTKGNAVVKYFCILFFSLLTGGIIIGFEQIPIEISAAFFTALYSAILRNWLLFLVFCLWCLAIVAYTANFTEYE
jgi:hypothetical protein